MLQPGAPLMFIEHVLSETTFNLMQLQLRLMHADSDGRWMSSDRKTLDVIERLASPPRKLKGFLAGFGLISPQVAGIAVA